MKPAETANAIVKEILIHAPAQRIFEALTDPLARVKWWGSPGKFEATRMESDLRPGGAWMMSGTAMGGREFVIRGEYRAVERPRLLEFTWRPDWPEPETLVRFELEETAGQTNVRLTHSGFTSEFTPDKYQGWPWLLTMLQKYVQTEIPA